MKKSIPRRVVKAIILVLFATALLAVALNAPFAPAKALRQAFAQGMGEDAALRSTLDAVLEWLEPAVAVFTPGVDVTDTLLYPSTGKLSKTYTAEEPYVSLQSTGTVRAAGDGKILYCRNGVIILEHPSELYSITKFTGNSNKMAGEYVKAGDILGQTKGGAVYFALRTPQGEMLDPALYCEKDE